jgi:hypothetical protein
MRRGLFGLAVEQQGAGRHHAAETDVGDVAHALQRHQHQHVGTRRQGVFRTAHHHAPGQAARVEAQRLQQQQEQAIEFEAVTPTPLMQQLVLDRSGLDLHRHTQHGRQRFEGELGGVPPLQLAQIVEGRCRCRGIAQALQVPLQVQHEGFAHRASSSSSGGRFVAEKRNGRYTNHPDRFAPASPKRAVSRVGNAKLVHPRGFLVLPPHPQRELMVSTLL